MASLGFQFHNSEKLMPDDFGWPPKCVGGNIRMYIRFVCASIPFLNKIRSSAFHMTAFPSITFCPTAYALTFHAFMSCCTMSLYLQSARWRYLLPAVQGLLIFSANEHFFHFYRFVSTNHTVISPSIIWCFLTVHHSIDLFQ